MLTRMLGHPKRHRLGYRLLGVIVLASALVALLVTGFQLWREYERSVAEIDAQFEQVRRSSLDSLANSIWSFNDTQIRLQLNGLLRMPDTRFVEVEVAGSERFAAGRPPDGGAVIERRFELRHNGGAVAPLGTLRVVVGLEGLYQRLRDQATTILLGETAKTFLIGLLILFVVSRWVTRHLVRMADYARTLSLDRLGAPLVLQRRSGVPDELDFVAAALNQMSRALAGELERRAAIDAERLKLFEAYEHNRSLLQAIIDNTSAIIFVKDLESRYLLVNRRYREVFTGGDDPTGRTADEVFPERAAAILVTDQRALASEGSLEYEIESTAGDEPRTYLALKFPLKRPDGELFALGCIATDITERKRAEQRIRYLAQHDALTGLPNRLLLRDRITQAIAQARRGDGQVGVLFIDLDHFKNVNDSLGHEAGDRLLETVAERLRAGLREGDTVARLGGDEFVITLPWLRASNDALPIAEKLLESLRQPVPVGTDLLRVTGSIGVALFPADGEDADALMRAADAAMYHAKDKGRDNVQFFTPKLNEAAQRRVSVATRLQQALRRGEFRIHFQPQIHLESGRVFGAEALIRWEPADGVAVAPAEFVRIAEETGLIVPLGEWILRESCSHAARWHSAGYTDVSVAVNLSPQQLLRPGFVEFAAQVLAQTGLPAGALELEITEGVLMMRSPENLAALCSLAAMGIRLAIDDFGTGYSSLAYLQRFPVEVVKVDRSFVDGIGNDANDTAIVAAVIAMAHSLRLKVVAEGVETTTQLEFLKRHGCLAAQGFLFSGALPVDEFVALLRAAASRRGGASVNHMPLNSPP